MPARTPTRRRLSSAIAATERHGGPADPRLAPLREQLEDATLIEEAEAGLSALDALMKRARARLLPLPADDIAALGRRAAALDARLDEVAVA